MLSSFIGSFSNIEFLSFFGSFLNIELLSFSSFLNIKLSSFFGSLSNSELCSFICSCLNIELCPSIIFFSSIEFSSLLKSNNLLSFFSLTSSGVFFLLSFIDWILSLYLLLNLLFNCIYVLCYHLPFRLLLWGSLISLLLPLKFMDSFSLITIVM